MALFFVVQMQPRDKRSVLKELLAGFVSSVFLGFGILFLMLWAGMFV